MEIMSSFIEDINLESNIGVGKTRIADFIVEYSKGCSDQFSIVVYFIGGAYRAQWKIITNNSTLIS